MSRTYYSGMRRVAWAIVLIFSLSTLQAFAITPPKSGSKCSKQGITKTFNGKKYTCTKSGKKLVWSKGVRAPKPNPSPTPTASSSTKPTPTPSPSTTPSTSPTPSISATPDKLSLSDPISLCKIQDNSKYEPGVNGGYAFGGFTNKIPPVSATGVHTWYLIPVDFADLRGESNWRARVETEMKNVSEFYSLISYGKMKIEWKVYENWITLPGSSKDYSIPFSGEYVTTEFFWKNAINEADKYIDFKGIMSVNLVLPKGQAIVKESAQGFPWTGDIRNHYSSEAKFNSFTILGDYFEKPWTHYWAYWVHEYGHVIGIPHLGGSRWAYSFQPYDLMGNQDVARDISGWSRFAVTKWIEDDWVYCKSKSNIESELFYLSPLNSTSNSTKLAVIPLDRSQTLILESRRINELPNLVPNYAEVPYLKGTYPLFDQYRVRNGVFAYIYDSSLGHNEEYLRLATNGGNPILAAGDSFSIGGITVKVLEVGNRDKVLISKSN